MTSQPSPYSAEQVEETRRFNAGLTQAGQKQRPGRGLNGRARSARGFGTSSSRHEAGGNTTRSVSGPMMLGNHPVTRPGALVRGVHSQVQSRDPTYAPPTSTTHSSVNTFFSNNLQPPPSSGFGAPPQTGTAPATNPFQADATPSASVATSTFGSSRQPQGFGSGSVGLTSSGGGPTSAAQHGFTTQPQSAAFARPNTQQNGIQAPSPPVSSGRQLIVTNWGPDPVGPVIPGHLRQPDASVAIMEIAQMIGMRYEDLTSDGMSIPVARPRAVSLQQPSTPHTGIREVSNGIRVQTNVDPTPWMESANKLKRHQAPATDMDVDAGDNNIEMSSAEPHRPTGNLQDSQWASSSAVRESTDEQRWDLPVKRPAPFEHGPTFSAPISAPTLPPYRNPAQATTYTDENARPMYTLKDSKWATPSVNTHHPSLTQPQGRPLQPVNNSWNSNPFSGSASTPSFSQGHNGFSANSFGQTTAAAPAQAPAATSFTFGAPTDSFPTKWRAAPVSSSSTFVFGQTNQKPNPFASTTTTAPAPALAAPKPAAALVAKVEKGKTLKDSMWAS